LIRLSWWPGSHRPSAHSKAVAHVLHTFLHSSSHLITSLLHLRPLFVSESVEYLFAHLSASLHILLTELLDLRSRRIVERALLSGFAQLSGFVALRSKCLTISIAYSADLIALFVGNAWLILSALYYCPIDPSTNRTTHPSTSHREHS
jgi:hypothetical protein